MNAQLNQLNFPGIGTKKTKQIKAVNALGRRLEITVEKIRRGTYKLEAENEQAAQDWCGMIKMAAGLPVHCRRARRHALRVALLAGNGGWVGNGGKFGELVRGLPARVRHSNPRCLSHSLCRGLACGHHFC